MPTDLQASQAADRNNERTFRLDEECELRFEVPADVSGITLVLRTGSAEMFGIELAHNRAYPLRPGLNGAVFTWHGATVVLRVGKASADNAATGSENGAAAAAGGGDNAGVGDASAGGGGGGGAGAGGGGGGGAGAGGGVTTEPASGAAGANNSAVHKVNAYMAGNTPMPAYINAHAILQSRREMARSAGLPGPRAVVVGTKDSGKTSVVQTLAAYSIKANGRVIVVDADPSGCGLVGVMPGVVSLSAASHIDLEDSGGILHEKLVSFYMGHVTPGENGKVSEAVYGALGAVLDQVLSSASFQPSVGCVVDTSGEVNDANGVQALLDMVRALKADVVFVLGSERLFASVRAKLDNSPTETVLLAKSGGTVSRDQPTRLALAASRTRDYFYGPDNLFNPFSTVLDFDATPVFKVGGAISQLPDSLLPVGAQSSLDPLTPTRVLSMHDLLHKILGVSQADKEEDVVTAPVYGFLHVVRVNVERNTIMVLAPSPGEIPGKFFVCGDMKWFE